jgi:cytochrome b561
MIALLLVVEFSLGLATRYLPPANWATYVRWHMPLGITILLLMVVRIIIRTRSQHPEPATTGNDILDKIGVVTHYLLYILAILMPLTGMALSITYGLSPFKSSLLANISWIPGLHKVIAPALGLLILLHISAAVYHEVIRKDNLMSRMWYGNPSPPSDDQ